MPTLPASPRRCIGQRGDVEWRRMLDVIAASAIGSPLNQAKSGIKTRDFSATFTCLQARKDLGLIVGAAAALAASALRSPKSPPA